MKIAGSVALVTGANRGLGQVYAREPGQGGRGQGVRRRAEPSPGH